VPLQRHAVGEAPQRRGAQTTNSGSISADAVLTSMIGDSSTPSAAIQRRAGRSCAPARERQQRREPQRHHRRQPHRQPAMAAQPLDRRQQP